MKVSGVAHISPFESLPSAAPWCPISERVLCVRSGKPRTLPYEIARITAARDQEAKITILQIGNHKKKGKGAKGPSTAPLPRHNRANHPIDALLPPCHDDGNDDNDGGDGGDDRAPQKRTR
jgi:hypothetical protein